MRNSESEQSTMKRWSRVGEWLDALLAGHGTQGCDGLELREIRFRMPTEDDPMVLMIVKGSTSEGEHIAFVGAGTPGQALLAWRKRDGGKGLKWRVDLPWTGES